MSAKRKACPTPEILKMPEENKGHLSMKSGEAYFDISLLPFGKNGKYTRQTLIIRRSGKHRRDTRYDKVINTAKKILGKEGTPFTHSYQKSKVRPRRRSGEDVQQSFEW
jgi:hypothetical protein